MSTAWTPGSDGPHEELVRRIHRRIADFLESRPAGHAEVEVELHEGATARLESISAEPGYGFVTLRPYGDHPGDAVEEWIVPVGAIARIMLREADPELEQFGFALPPS